MKNQALRDILKTSFYVLLILTFVFDVLAFVDYTLVIGWIVGSMTSIFSFTLASKVILSITKNSSKKKAFWVGMGKMWLQLIIHAIVLFIVIAINTKVSNARFFHSGLNAIEKPINFYTYLGGISLISVSTLINGLLKKGKNGQV